MSPMVLRNLAPVMLLVACASSAPDEDFGVLITPIRYIPPPGVRVDASRMVFGWVRAPEAEAEAYRLELGLAAKRQVHESTMSAPGNTTKDHVALYKEAARRFAEAELASRGLCPSGVVNASEVSADQRTQTPSFVVRCK